METSVITNQASMSETKAGTPAKVKTAATSEFWQKIEFNRFGIISLLLVIVACLGGIAASVAIQKSTLLLGMVALPAMAVEASILAVLPMRTIVIASAISALVSLSIAIIV